MKSYLEKAIELFGKDVSKKVSSIAMKKLLMVDPDSPLLQKKLADIFHSVVARLLWTSKRARPDIETAISCLCTRVKAPTVGDRGKLKRLLQFLNQTLDDRKIIGMDNLSELYTWIDAAYAVHPDMKSHTGGTMSFGLGLLHCRSGKQKLNTKSLTELEVVGTSDYVPYNFYLKNFIEAQGQVLKKNVIYQDNQSAMKMEKNGRNSCTWNSRHINIRYFFVKDRHDKKEITIEYCPTGRMLADYFTKPLQGRLFHIFREVIMRWRHISTLDELAQHPSKEHVGNMDGCDTVKLQGEK